MYAPLRTLNESLVPDEPLIPSSIPESHGAGPIQTMGEYQGRCGCSKIAVMAGSPATPAPFGSYSPGIGSSASGARKSGLAAVPTGGFHGSEGASAVGAAAGVAI